MNWWTDIEVCGKRAAFWDIGTKRLYVCEKAGAFEAWDGNRKVGIYDNIKDAKMAAEGRHVPKPECKPPSKFSSFKFVMDEPKVELPAEPVERRFEDLPKTSPFKFVANAPYKGLFVASDGAEPQSPPDTRAVKVEDLVVEIVLPEPLPTGYCSCGTKLGRRGKCPALCEAVCA